MFLDTRKAWPDTIANVCWNIINTKFKIQIPNTIQWAPKHQIQPKKKLRSQNSQNRPLFLGLVSLFFVFSFSHRLALTCLTPNSKQNSEVFGLLHGGLFLGTNSSDIKFFWLLSGAVWKTKYYNNTLSFMMCAHLGADASKKGVRFEVLELRNAFDSIIYFLLFTVIFWGWKAAFQTNMNFSYDVKFF